MLVGVCRKDRNEKGLCPYELFIVVVWVLGLESLKNNNKNKIIGGEIARMNDQ